MLKGICNHLEKNADISTITILASDIQERGNVSEIPYGTGKEYDFFSDNYPFVNDIDYIIMNPPYAVIEPFTMRALGIAKKGVLALCRLQFLEGEKRFENILSQCPPSDVYVYVDRIACYKNGNTNEKMASAQAYAWFYWNFTNEYTDTKVRWIRRADKKKSTEA